MSVNRITTAGLCKRLDEFYYEQVRSCEACRTLFLVIGWHEKTRGKPFDYCPACGELLPEDSREEREEE